MAVKHRSSRAVKTQHDSPNAGKTCHICKAPCNRKSKAVVFSGTQTVMACPSCVEKHSLEMV